MKFSIGFVALWIFTFALWLYALYLSISKYRMRRQYDRDMRDLRRMQFEAIAAIREKAAKK